VALVTGASSGIGAEMARIFAQKGIDLALTARREDRLQQLADEIEGMGRPRPLIFPTDLSLPEAPAQLITHVHDANAPVSILVNNAGYGLMKSFETADLPDLTGMLDVNVRALMALTHGLLPDLIETHGRLLNVASIAGFMPGPNMAVYYASKAFVVSF